MQRLSSTLLFVLLCTAAFAQSEKITGIWLTADKSAKVEIYNSKNQFEGKIIWLKEPNDPTTGKPWLDKENEISIQKTLPLMGSLTLWGFKYDDDEYIDGKVYDSRDGKVYSGKLWLEDVNTLCMRGYIGLFYSTEIWSRVK